MPTIYDLKPAFQNFLRPLTRRLAAAGVTANQVTLAAAAMSLFAGAAMAWRPQAAGVFWLLPLVLFLRMALNAVDGMLAREHGQKTKLGMYLNELADMVSDAALILPFALVPLFPGWGVVFFALLAVLTEAAGILGVAAGAGRIYAGPFGKSDRAAALGLLAVVLALRVPLPLAIAAAIFPLLALLSLLTVANRVHVGLRGSEGRETGS